MATRKRRGGGLRKKLEESYTQDDRANNGITAEKGEEPDSPATSHHRTPAFYEDDHEFMNLTFIKTRTF